MNEYLIVRLSNKSHESIQWLVWSELNQNVVASGELSHREQLNELLAYSHPEGEQARTIIALVPSCQVLLTQVQIPPGASRQLDTMLPFLMEDMLTQDIDSTHFSILKKQDDKAVVASLSLDYLSTWLDDFKQLGMSVSRVLPDVLALPYQENHVTAFHYQAQWLFRQGETKGASVDSDWLDLFLNSGWLMPEGDALSLDDVVETENETKDAASELTQGSLDPQSAPSFNALDDDNDTKNLATDEHVVIDCYSPLPVNVAELPGHWRAMPEADLALAQFASTAARSKINLLTGPFKPQAQWRKHWLTWRKVAVAAGVFFCVLFAQKWLQLNQVEAQYQSYRAENERIFRAALPGKKRIPTVSYLKREIENEISTMSGGEASNSALAWVARLPEAFDAAPKMNLLSLKYDGQRGELTLQAQGDDFQPFEQLRAELATSFNVEQGQLTKNNDQVFGSYVLRELP
ncbi:MAG: type II secretion system protein GspL [Vibrio sp.]